MKQIRLTQGKVALIDDKDFEKVNKHKWYAANYKWSFYAVTHIRVNGKQKTVLMHRFILNPSKKKVVDHKNFDGLDNRRENIRIVTQSENVIHTRRYEGKRVGVSKNGKSKNWKAEIKVKGKTFYLGSYVDKEEAYKAYQDAHLKYRGISI